MDSQSSPPAGLSERDRRYLMQCAQNAYDNRHRDELERVIRRLLSLIPQPVPKEEPPCSDSP